MWQAPKPPCGRVVWNRKCRVKHCLESGLVLNLQRLHCRSSHSVLQTQHKVEIPPPREKEEKKHQDVKLVCTWLACHDSEAAAAHAHAFRCAPCPGAGLINKRHSVLCRHWLVFYVCLNKRATENCSLTMRYQWLLTLFKNCWLIFFLPHFPG